MGKNFSITLLCLLVSTCFVSCEKHNVDLNTTPDEIPIKTDDYYINLSVSYVPVYNFNWETVDWMPTPSGQSQISPPWIGQGTLASFYGLDILNDHKASDGWVLLYSTFDPNAPAPVSNPYFILYNKYRGLMRVYFYLTESSFISNANLQDGLFINSSYPTSMLNFMGRDIVDATVNQVSYTQNQPASRYGGWGSLASLCWYMMQYEMAYDPNLSQIPSDKIALNWYLNCCNIDSVKLGGTMMRGLNGIIGTASSSSSNILSQFPLLGKISGAGVFVGIGKDVINDNTIDKTTGENSLGLPDNVFNKLVEDINDTSVPLPGSGNSLLSVGYGGNSNGLGPITNFNLKVNIEMKGSITNIWSYSSNPIPLPVPGTQGKPVYGTEPLYNEILGVINFKGKPTISLDVKCKNYTDQEIDHVNPSNIYNWTEYTATFPVHIDYSNYLEINPKVLEIANVTIQKQDLVLIASLHYHDSYDYGHDSEYDPEINPNTLFWYEGIRPWRQDVVNNVMNYPDLLKLGVRFTIKVEPKNGSPASIIIKTFELKYVWNYIQI